MIANGHRSDPPAAACCTVTARVSCYARLCCTLAAASGLMHQNLFAEYVCAAARIELPRLKHLCAHCGTCLRPPLTAAVRVHRSLLCPTAEAAHLRLRPCEHS